MYQLLIVILAYEPCSVKRGLNEYVCLCVCEREREKEKYIKPPFARAWLIYIYILLNLMYQYSFLFKDSRNKPKTVFFLSDLQTYSILQCIIMESLNRKYILGEKKTCIQAKNIFKFLHSL